MAWGWNGSSTSRRTFAQPAHAPQKSRLHRRLRPHACAWNCVNTAIFSVVYAVVLKPLPYPDSQHLYTIFQQRTQDASVQAGFSYLDLQDVIAQDAAFSGMTGVSAHELTLTGHGDPFIVRVADVTPELFSVFEQQPLLGRVFRHEDGKPGAAPCRSSSTKVCGAASSRRTPTSSTPRSTSISAPSPS